MIELGKTYRTRDGREVRIYAVDGSGMYPTHGAVLCGGWRQENWSIQGICNIAVPNGNLDLIEVKPRIVIEKWANVYKNCGNQAVFHNSRGQADGVAGCDQRLACVKIVIDCEEGEGLNCD